MPSDAAKSGWLHKANVLNLRGPRIKPKFHYSLTLSQEYKAHEILQICNILSQSVQICAQFSRAYLPSPKWYSSLQKIKQQFLKGTLTGFNCLLPNPNSTNKNEMGVQPISLNEHELQITIQVDNPFYVQNLSLVLTQFQSLPLQKVLHVQNTVSKIISGFSIFVVPSPLLLACCPFLMFFLKFSLCLVCLISLWDLIGPSYFVG